MFDNIVKFFKNLGKKEKNKESSDTAKERLHLVLMQDRANVSADFLELMRQEIIEVIKKYIDIDEKSIDVRLTNKTNDDGTVGAPALYANIPIVTIKNEARIANVPHKNNEKLAEDIKHKDDKLENDSDNENKNNEKENKPEDNNGKLKEKKTNTEETNKGETVEESKKNEDNKEGVDESKKVIEEAEKIKDEIEKEEAKEEGEGENSINEDNSTDEIKPQGEKKNIINNIENT